MLGFFKKEELNKDQRQNKLNKLYSTQINAIKHPGVRSLVLNNEDFNLAYSNFVKQATEVSQSDFDKAYLQASNFFNRISSAGKNDLISTLEAAAKVNGLNDTLKDAVVALRDTMKLIGSKNIGSVKMVFDKTSDQSLRDSYVAHVRETQPQVWQIDGNEDVTLQDAYQSHLACK